VMIDGVVEPVKGGCAVLFPQGEHPYATEHRAR
jgi:hypothetical protein